MAGAKTGSRRDNTSSTKTGETANPKRSESNRIAEHIAAFERNGGQVEKLGTTRVLQKIDAPPADAVVVAPAAPAKKRVR